jgi:hypothetical protein
MDSISPEKYCFSSKEHLQVKEFLDSCYLSQYYANFINEGFESLQAVSLKVLLFVPLILPPIQKEASSCLI